MHPFDEAGHGRRIRGRYAVTQHLDGPERAEVVVALVVEGIVQRGRGVLDLGVQPVGEVGAGVEPLPLAEEADQRVEGGRDGVAVVGEQRDRAREPHREGVRDVGARPVAQPSVHAVLVVQRGRYQRRFHQEATSARPRHDVQPQPVPDEGIRLQVVGAEDELHRGTLPAAALRHGAGVARRGDRGDGTAVRSPATNGDGMRAVQVVRLDGPAAIEVRDVPEPARTPQQVLVDVAEAGVSFPDVLMSRGLYQMPARPALHAGRRVRGRRAGGAGGHRVRAGRPRRGLPRPRRLRRDGRRARADHGLPAARRRVVRGRRRRCR